jgi:hypothetical protein
MGALFPNTARRRRSPVSTEDIDAVFAAASGDPSVYGARDAAIIALICETGLGTPEVVALQIDHFDPDAALISISRLGHSMVVNPGSVACQALDRWLYFRGRLPGALINPIRRPDRILIKPIASTAVSDALFRRSNEAGIAPFTAGDLARTGSMLISGRWHAAPRRPFGSVGLFRERTEGDPLPTRNPGQLLVVRFLSRHGHARRCILLERLNRLALLISGGTHHAFAFDWTGVRANQFPLPGGAFGNCDLRALNKMKSALHGVLREGITVGVLDQHIYASIVGQKWTNRSSERDAATGPTG